MDRCLDLLAAGLTEALMALAVGAVCVVGALVVILIPSRPRNRRRHTIGRRLQASGQLRRML